MAAEGGNMFGIAVDEDASSCEFGGILMVIFQQPSSGHDVEEEEEEEAFLGVPERKQGWRQKLICSSSTQHVCAASSLFKSRSKSGVRKLRTAGSCGGSAEICEGQPAPWLSTWPTKQVRIEFRRLPRHYTLLNE
ncbi:hypothetical protein SDJN02_07370, partial [Cucurbita argyrosperma subsp. argyrosperma]